MDWSYLGLIVLLLGTGAMVSTLLIEGVTYARRERARKRRLRAICPPRDPD
jgi:hypothetical protein